MHLKPEITRILGKYSMFCTIALSSVLSFCNADSGDMQKAPLIARASDIDLKADTDKDGYANGYEIHNGSDFNDNTSIPKPTFYYSPINQGIKPFVAFSTLTKLIESDQVKDYAIIALEGGIYHGFETTNIIIDNKKIMLVPQTPSDRPVIDCAEGGVGLYLMNNSAETTIKGLTFINAIQTPVFMKNDASQFVDCTFSNNRAPVYVENSTPLFSNCTMTGPKDLNGNLLVFESMYVEVGKQTAQRTNSDMMDKMIADGTTDDPASNAAKR